MSHFYGISNILGKEKKMSQQDMLAFDLQRRNVISSLFNSCNTFKHKKYANSGRQCFSVWWEWDALKTLACVSTDEVQPRNKLGPSRKP